MDTKVKSIIDRFSMEEVLEMIKEDDFTEDGRWQAVHVEKIRGFYYVVMVITKKGRYYEYFEENKKDYFFREIEFESEDLPFEEIEKKALDLCPAGFTYMYVDFKNYVRRNDNKVINNYRALYEIR